MLACGSAVGRDVLDDHVDRDVLLGDPLEELRRDARLVVDADDVHPRLALVVGDAAHDDALQQRVFLGHHGPRGVVERASDVHRHAVLHRDLHAADLQDLGAQRRELEHLLVGDALDLPRRGADVRVGRVDAVDVRVDLALVGADGRGDGDGARVGAAAAERRDVAGVVDPLEAGDDGDLAAVYGDSKIFEPSMVLMRALVNAPSVRILDLVAEERPRLAALGLDGDRGERGG